MFLLICKLYICIQNVFGHIFYRSRLHLYWQFWQFEVQKLAYMLILAAGGMIPYLSSVPPHFGISTTITLQHDCFRRLSCVYWSLFEEDHSQWGGSVTPTLALVKGQTNYFC